MPPARLVRGARVGIVSAMTTPPDGLRSALDAALAAVPSRELADATAALVARYRDVRPAGSPILTTATQVAAYAAYRMPATHAALRRVLRDVAEHLPATATPRSVLDLGGGTGAAAWAAAEVWGDLESVTVLDQVEPALALGRRLVAGAPGALGRARFDRVLAGAWPSDGADLVTVSYVLSELTGIQQERLVDDAMARGRVVVVVEPGTPDGYRRVLDARGRLLASGWSLLGPCPHEARCPLVGSDWCHFAARVNRSAEHRRIKGGTLSYEDEKYSWVAAADPGVAVPQQDRGRVLRHPLKRKGLVELTLCRPDGSADRDVVSRRAGERYRLARDVAWGDELPLA